MPKGRGTSEEERRKVRDMDAAGKFYSEIQAETGLCRSTIKNILRNR